MYWSDFYSGDLMRADLDGSNLAVLVPSAWPFAIALDVGAGKLYWGDFFHDRIRRANLDGTDIEDVVTTESGIVYGIALDFSADKLYWSFGGLPGRWLRRADMDGSDVETLLYPGATATDVAVDPVSGKLYWAASGIHRANLDGSGRESLEEVSCGASGLALDLDRGRVYWTATCQDRMRIERANLDGSGYEPLVTEGLVEPSGIALDLGRGKMYWTDADGHRIMRANLDGTEVEVLVARHLSSPRDIALDVGAGKMYLTDQSYPTAGVLRANLDGSDLEPLVTAGVVLPHAIALNLNLGRVYWTEGGHRIRYADLDGKNVSDLVPSLVTRPRNIAVDLLGGKIYWTEGEANVIRRSDLDGSQVEDVISTGLATPDGIAVYGYELYWSENNPANPKIRRASVHDFLPTDLVVGGLGAPTSLVLDPLAYSMYWIVQGHDARGVRAAFMDGTNVRDLTGIPEASPVALALDSDDHVLYLVSDRGEVCLTRPEGYDCLGLGGSPGPVRTVAVDTQANKLYWTLHQANPGEPIGMLIRRTNMDGLEAEDLVTLEGERIGPLALDPTGEKMYWFSDRGRIQRAGLDGSDVQELVRNVLDNPGDIAVDPRDGKVYWTDGDRIQRCDADGAGIEDLVTEGIDGLNGLALDPVLDQMYWAEGATNRIRRANLDGSQPELVLSTSPTAPEAIALDPDTGDLYWTGRDGNNVSIYRETEPILTPDHAPASIALDLRTLGDCDGDGAFSLADHAEFAACMTGPGSHFAIGCGCADPSGDSHIDLIDFARLQRRLTIP
jgi:low density lipoprotein receptor-related protein 5/6